MINIICSVILIVILPGLLIWKVFRTDASKTKKALLVPVCILAPNILYFLWPAILVGAGILKITGEASYLETVQSWASLGDAGTIAWTVLTAISVAFYVYVTTGPKDENT